MLFDWLRLLFFRAWAKKHIRAAWGAIPDGRRLLRFHTGSGREILAVLNKNMETRCFEVYVEGIGPEMPRSFYLLHCVNL